MQSSQDAHKKQSRQVTENERNSPWSSICQTLTAFQTLCSQELVTQTSLTFPVFELPKCPIPYHLQCRSQRQYKKLVLTGSHTFLVPLTWSSCHPLPEPKREKITSCPLGAQKPKKTMIAARSVCLSQDSLHAPSSLRYCMPWAAGSR